MNSSRLQVEEYKKGILAGDRVVLAKAITLAESTLVNDQRLAGDVLDAIIGHTGNSLRIGITGAPGVGKSTFIESFGKTILESGKKLAVLTVDPTSQLTSGSILGDKTRMQELAKDPRAFIRPTPSGPTLGGVAAYTRETMLLCEAAGYEIIIVETVGTGQSEISIKNMVDFFLLLMQPGSGDELQGIKKGIVEMADAIAITKADGENVNAAKATQAEFQHALHLLHAPLSGWEPRVVTCSALELKGLREIQSMIENFKQDLSASGYFQANREAQQTEWLRDHFNLLLALDPKQFPQVIDAERNLKDLVQSKKLSPRKAAQDLLDIYHRAVRLKA
ncbi:MAG TPA: methylmalonyl Co-A mutase-associated GTPase MeaB [Chryseosolibacter sp.]|nr:methylmalonyl Co-A mutase-associated GTPase MeaB [Chryseosolibacter sp.]